MSEYSIRAEIRNVERELERANGEIREKGKQLEDLYDFKTQYDRMGNEVAENLQTRQSNFNRITLDENRSKSLKIYKKKMGEVLFGSDSDNQINNLEKNSQKIRRIITGMEDDIDDLRRDCSKYERTISDLKSELRRVLEEQYE